MDFAKQEKLKTWGLLGTAALTIGLYTPYEMHQRKETEKVAATVRDNVIKMQLPGLVDCRRNIGMDRTECTIDFRHQTVRPELGNCYVEMACRNGASGPDCFSVIRGDNVTGRCESVLEEASKESKI